MSIPVDLLPLKATDTQIDRLTDVTYFFMNRWLFTHVLLERLDQAILDVIDNP